MNPNAVIPCPKCRHTGILYAERSIPALIASKHIAHVLHEPSGENRRICMLTRSELERIQTQLPKTAGRPQ